MRTGAILGYAPERRQRAGCRDVLLSGETQSGDPGAGTVTRSGQPSVSRVELVSTQAVSVDRDIASEYLVRLQAWIYRCGGELGHHTDSV